jgi:sialate O-acetylesterase
MSIGFFCPTWAYPDVTMKDLHKILIFLFIAPLTASPAANLRFANIFADHCVLQREMPVPVWGWAEPGSQVTVGFAGQKKTAQAGADGKWLVRLNPIRASREPRKLVVSSAGQTLTLDDILVGEVWLCSGQSNMGLGLSKATGGEEAIANANHPRLRMFRLAQHPNYDPYEERDVKGEWLVCSPEALRNGGRFPEVGKGFSAVGFFFGRQLLESLDCPIGLIGSYVGGSPVEAWMSEEALAAYPDKRSQTASRFRDYQKARDGMEKAMAEHAPKLVVWEGEWAARNEAHRKDLAAWQAATQKAREANKPVPERPQPNPLSRRPLEPNRFPLHATVLFRGMIEPLVPYGIRGAIWYQGEGNCYPERAKEYATSFPMMICDWRARWGQGDFPFLFVQLPNFAKGKVWMTLRESQRLTAMQVPNTAMAVTIDVGDPNDLHPVDKKPVGERLALLARAKVYGEDVIASGPLVKSAMWMDGGQVRLVFQASTSQLQVGSAGGENLGGFELAGKDGKFLPAKAMMDGAGVIVWREGLEPVEVRYAWAPDPFPVANLYNDGGLPASPFSILVE